MLQPSPPLFLQIGQSRVSERKYLTSCEYQRSHDKIIEEGNSYFSRWISDVASTGEKVVIFRTDVLSSQYRGSFG